MIALEGTGTVSHVSVSNSPDVFNSPLMFAAISVKGIKNGSKVLEGRFPSGNILAARIQLTAAASLPPDWHTCCFPLAKRRKTFAAFCVQQRGLDRNRIPDRLAPDADRQSGERARHRVHLLRQLLRTHPRSVRRIQMRPLVCTGHVELQIGTNRGSVWCRMLDLVYRFESRRL